ncbi:hypothetical protein FEM48_ZijujUnG0007600 [Ziziphus jujuba var. spinosa]|uniref:Protein DETOXIFICATION 16-like n=1 Tax=Ziziphus jujuba var. spinosa TaxID=714518 RepID=A0A978UA07_ZIZJJ|nr:hypothetical protein FEM48_ZijujUnG0007600 [Ziziphus jujuba var. spinosa]
MGLSSALETLSGQAYGGKQYHMLGIHMQRAMFVLLLVSIPLTIIWANTRSILTLLSSSCAKSWTRFSKESLQNIPTSLKLSIPSDIMVCLELWPFGMMVLLFGHLPNPELETSVLSICTRVSNELGVGHPKAAHLAVCVGLAMVIAEGISMGLVFILIHNIWGYAFSNEVEVVKYVAIMMPILAISNFLDGF